MNGRRPTTIGHRRAGTRRNEDAQGRALCPLQLRHPAGRLDRAQLRLCRLYAEKQGWTIVETYSDRAVSGASLIRPGVQALLSDATRDRFDLVLAEALDCKSAPKWGPYPGVTTAP